ncbi:MAG: hypothetical protein ABI615_03825 [Chthoniobacterales bacterium]
MKFFKFFLLSILWPTGIYCQSEDVCHFQRVDIPRDESRLSALAGLREWRCDYEFSRFSPYALLIAEVYKDGACVGKYRLSYAVYDNTKKTKNGIISIGWQKNTDTLVSVNDNGEFYSPWAESIHLFDFQPVDAFFFSNSAPEKRKPEKKNAAYRDFELYPVVGICGARNLKIAYGDITTAKQFLSACWSAKAKNAVIIYLYMTDGGDPAMNFSKPVKPE